MRFAFDVDGVLAAFDQPFAHLLTTVTGRPCILEEPDIWEWPEKLGFTQPEEHLAWEWIDRNPGWWGALDVYADARGTPPYQLADLEADKHELYFVTARHGDHVQRITAAWLTRSFLLRQAAVILTTRKGLFCKALRIDAFIDDKPEMCVDVKIVSPRTRTYLRCRPHNAMAYPYLVRDGIILTDSVTTFVQHELSRLRPPVSESPRLCAEHPNR